jgi:hypothetical protein
MDALANKPKRRTPLATETELALAAFLVSSLVAVALFAMFMNRLGAL